MAKQVSHSLVVQCAHGLVLSLVLALSSTITSCTAKETHEIYPVCRHPEVDLGCLTLSDIVQHRDDYFISNSTLLFYPGDYSLEWGLVLVANVSNLTLQGYCDGNSSDFPTARITCVNSFSDASVHIVSITFNHCTTMLSHTVAVFHNVTIENGTGSHGYGGALSTYHSNVDFEGLNTFAHNTAGTAGGAVFAHNSDLTFSGKITFTDNTAENGGAIYVTERSNLSLNGDSNFTGNIAGRHGGALYVLYSNTLTFKGSCIFVLNIAVWNGGALYALYDNSLSFNGSNTFVSNIAIVGGGVLYTSKGNTLSFDGSSFFVANRARVYGGAMSVSKSNSLNFNKATHFVGNIANYTGGALYVENSSSLSFDGESYFVSNGADRGGAVAVQYGNTLRFNGDNNFVSNRADDSGGALHIGDSNSLSFNGNNRFVSNRAGLSGGALFLWKNNSLSFVESSNFQNTAAVYGGGISTNGDRQIYFAGHSLFSLNTAVFGGAIAIDNSSIEGNGNIEVTDNQARYGGGFFVQSGSITLHGAGWFYGNSAAQYGYGGAIHAVNSIIFIGGSYYISRNKAGFGGGLAVTQLNSGVLMLKSGTNVTFQDNIAHVRGGAIHVLDNPYTYCLYDGISKESEACFLQSEWLAQRRLFCNERRWPLTFDGTHIALKSSELLVEPLMLVFENNSAAESGDILYGGNLETCGDDCIAFSSVALPAVSSISSDPYKVCICDNNHPDCNHTTVNLTVYPSETLSLSVAAVGQLNGTVPSVVRAVPDNLRTTSDFKITQPVGDKKGCTQLHYPLLLNASLKLYADEPCSTSGFPLTVLITFLPCPVGFSLSDQGACVCEKRLQKYTEHCVVQNETAYVIRQQGETFWVGVENFETLILHPHCPFDYCREESVTFPLDNTDRQCTNGRSGILCGACKSDHSLALGSSRCLNECSNKSLALLIVFVLAGVVLIAFLLLCRLTVAEGAISGHIFYANVLTLNHDVFFPSGEHNPLTIFIAWLNLDLGIETCFFVSLDIYSRTWLQFVFPIYIWVLVGLLIYAADRSTFFARLIGRTNPTAVLATLFLLSYTKLLRANMIAFSFTTLDYPEDKQVFVWLYDGNIGYLDHHDGRHIALFLFSLVVLLFLFLPYSALLLCGQWIQKRMGWLSPTKQLYLKSFLDAYHAPYRNRHRYWPGLLLVIRFLMLVLSTIINIGSPQDPFSNLMVMIVVLSCLLVWGWGTGGLYKKWYLDLLEASFILNLLVLTGGTYQVRQSGGSQAALVYTSVSIAFATFTGIVVTAVVQLVKVKLAERRRHACDRLILAACQTQNEEEDPPESPNAAPTSTVTYSVLEMVHHNSQGRPSDIVLKSLLVVPIEDQ